MRVLWALLMCLAVATGVWGQAEVPPKAPASVVHCKKCHTSDARPRSTRLWCSAANQDQGSALHR